jgi:hypothetical protein
MSRSDVRLNSYEVDELERLREENGMLIERDRRLNSEICDILPEGIVDYLMGDLEF